MGSWRYPPVVGTSQDLRPRAITQACADALSFPWPFAGSRCCLERAEALGPTLGPFL